MRITDLLRTMDIFERLPEDELDKIARLLRERRLTEGQLLMREGEAGDAMFIVTGGRIRLSTVDVTGNEKVLTYFGDGQFFGEMALLTGAPRSATATAETESRVLVLQKDDFDQLLSANAQILREMLKVVSQRTVSTSQALLSDEASTTAATGGGRVYVVFSPRGGAGKTTVAVNLAASLAQQMPERVGLLDLDLTFGHAALLLNVTPETSLAAVPPETLETFDRQTLAPYLNTVSGGLQLLVGGTRPEEGEAVTGDHVRAVLEVMKRQFIVTVVDTSGTFSDPTLAALEAADKVLVVCTPELNTLRDIREAQRIFGEVMHFEKTKIYYVLNHNQAVKVLSKEQFEASLEQPVNVEIPHAGDAAIKAALKGEPLVVGNGGAPFTRAIDRMTLEFLPDEVRAQRAKLGKQPATTVLAASNGAASAAKPKGMLRFFRRA